MGLFTGFFSFLFGTQTRYSRTPVTFSKLDLKEFFENKVHISTLPTAEKEFIYKELQKTIGNDGHVSLQNIYDTLRKCKYTRPIFLSDNDIRALMKIFSEYWKNNF